MADSEITPPQPSAPAQDDTLRDTAILDAVDVTMSDTPEVSAHDSDEESTIKEEKDYNEGSNAGSDSDGDRDSNTESKAGSEGGVDEGEAGSNAGSDEGDEDDDEVSDHKLATEYTDS